MKNKKGFTLIEILAVVVLLALIFTIGAVSISGVRNKIDKNLFEEKLQAIVKGAENYGIDNVTDGSKTLSVYELIKSNYLAVDETVASTDLATGETCISAGNNLCKAIAYYEDETSINNLEVKIYLENKRVHACIIKNDNNKALLHEEDDFSIFNDLGLYC